MPSQRTLTDIVIARLKNNPVLSVLFVVGAGTIATASFLDAATEISEYFNFGNQEAPSVRVAIPKSGSSTHTAVSKKTAESPIPLPFHIGNIRVSFANKYLLSNLHGYDPAFSGDGQFIAFCSRNFGGPQRNGSDLMLSSDGGRSAIPLFTSESVKFQPQISFDNRYVAFLAAGRAPRYRWQGRGELWIKSISSAPAKRVSDPDVSVVYDTNYITNFDWSPVRNQIAYVFEEYDGGQTVTKLAVYDLDSGRTQIVGKPEYSDKYNPLSSPQWSKDGKKLGVLAGGAGEETFFHVNLKDEGRKFTRARNIEISSSFDWLDSDTIIFDAGGAGTYRLATYKFGDAAPTYVTRSGYFHTPSVLRDSIGLLRRTEVANDVWVLAFQLRSTLKAESKSVVELTGGFHPPDAQNFQEPHEKSDNAASVPSRLALDSLGKQGVISIDEKIYVTRISD